jgi:hypothetical protein
MSYIADIKTEYNQDNRAMYRGQVKEYTGTPTVNIYQCPITHGSRIQAERDAKKLVTKLKKHARTLRTI